MEQHACSDDQVIGNTRGKQGQWLVRASWREKDRIARSSLLLRIAEHDGNAAVQTLDLVQFDMVHPFRNSTSMDQSQSANSGVAESEFGVTLDQD